MATVEEIIEESLGLVDDPGVEDMVDMEALVNRGVRAIASNPYILLPGLEGYGTVDTVIGGAFVDLPANYHKGLYGCSSTSHPDATVDVIANLGVMQSKYGPLNNKGTVATVCVRGKQLCYQRVPETIDTLTLYFYEQPVDYTSSEIPVIIPEQFHDNLLVEFCCWKLFSRIEDGMDGAKVNSDYYRSEFYGHLAELEAYIGRDGAQSKRRPPVVRGRF